MSRNHYGSGDGSQYRDPAGGWGPNGAPSYDNSMAALDPPSAYGEVGGQKVPWYREPVLEPRIFFPNDLYTAKQIRWRNVVVENEAIGTEIVRLINIDIPSTVYAFTGGARDTTNVLQLNDGGRGDFLVRYAHNSGDRLTPTAGLGTLFCGDARFPALVGAAGWVFNRGGSIEVGITPLRANLRIEVAAWVVEIRSHQNYNPPG
mgnify:FL=1